MDTSTEILLTVLTVLLSIFFIIMIAVAVGIFKLVSMVKRVVVKAESVVDSVESAAEVLKDTSGRMAFFKLIRNIMKIVKDKK
jgi:hypothetical protein